VREDPNLAIERKGSQGEVDEFLTTKEDELEQYRP
jgi:hypothetical protein